MVCHRLINQKLSFQFIFAKQKFKPNLLCTKCKNKFSKIHEKNRCLGCSRTQPHTSICEDCKKWGKKYPKMEFNHTALFSYNQMAKYFMDQYKFQGDVLLAEVWGEALYSYLINFSKTHVIVPIPISKNSQKSRGFNQVEQLLLQAEIPFQKVLLNTSDSQLQSSKNREERLKTKQPFELFSKDWNLEKEKSKVLIVDDVYTTGRTILHARQLIEGHFEGKVKTASFSLFR